MEYDEDEDQLESKLFAIDGRGYRVYYSELQLDEIYEHHKELMNFWANINDMKLAITKSRFIYESIHGPCYHVYYRNKRNNNAELKVVVKFDDQNIGTLCMAQPSTVGQRNKGEKLIWVAKSP
jgi:hypothetical protein